MRRGPVARRELPQERLSEQSACPPLQGVPGRFSTRAVYALHRLGGVGVVMATFLWSNRHPSRVKFFGWLLTLSRVHTWDVLLHKTIVTAKEVGCLCCEAVLETAGHLISGCPFGV
ncbi:hypothetical protein D1007_35869 [Hordeum vulgare]|nr:hypothetical protein D1007_35869 [Hordeum vulgare]